MKNFLNGTYFTKKVTEKLDENLKERENNKPVGTFEKNQKTDLTKLKTLWIVWVIFLIILGAFSSRNHHTSFLEKISFLTDIGVLCIFVGYCIFIKNTSFLLKILVLLYLILFPLAYLRVDYYLNNETFLLWERYKSPLFIITWILLSKVMISRISEFNRQ